MRAIMILLLTAGTANAGDLASTFKAVCDSSAVKSAKLIEACAAGAAPVAIKDGSRFKAQGIGAEINILSANLKFFVDS